jgi:hypothetical protein
LALLSYENLMAFALHWIFWLIGEYLGARIFKGGWPIKRGLAVAKAI